MAFRGLIELPAFAEQWLRKRRWHVISGSFMTVVSSEMGRMKL